ncbi:uncharacterized protein MELLADRAFT_94634 [Melampsora larici-populina 98AG31]|uniref:FAR1 domain-containing protein n=1 Tax=Melampsora larici-populina (strain 98AG31 / pathotype 3-4-7) TaxID=747676 RepID=F4S7E6_MELLP|nr:uncharacterized protein MELLADRAFT_94634 [Melampsora larici-populina 98AG31]EGF99393.1 hypothetical protein MELLADRAFT_94634 [Melampsora larici-populina 98AG31]
MTEIPPPEARTGFKTRLHAILYIQEHANNNGFRVTIKDSRAKWVQFKCHLGPTRHKDTNSNANTKTCGFLSTSKLDSSDGTWNFTIQNANHNHEPDFNIHKHDLAILRDTISKEEEKQHRNIVTPQIPSGQILIPHIQSVQPSTSAITPPFLILQYQALQQQMQALPMQSQVYLLTRFLSECQLSAGLANTVSTPIPTPLPPNPLPEISNTTPQDSTTPKASNQSTNDEDTQESRFLSNSPIKSNPDQSLLNIKNRETAKSGESKGKEREEPPISEEEEAPEENHAPESKDFEEENTEEKSFSCGRADTQ